MERDEVAADVGAANEAATEDDYTRIIAKYKDCYDDPLLKKMMDILPSKIKTPNETDAVEAVPPKVL